MTKIDISSWGMFVIGDIMNKLDLKIKKKTLTRDLILLLKKTKNSHSH